MINVKLNYFLLQVINAALLLLSILFVTETFYPDGNRTATGFVILSAVLLGGMYAFFTNRIFYILIKDAEGAHDPREPHR